MGRDDPDPYHGLDGFARRDVRAGAAVTKGAAPSAWSSARPYAVLSVVTAVLTIVLKLGAYLLTGSVGLFSDAAESAVNLVAAVGVLLALGTAARPPDEEHAYGHTKAEYFSSALESVLLIMAAGGDVVYR